MFDDVDDALDNAGAASPEDLQKAVGIAKSIAGLMVTAETFGFTSPLLDTLRMARRFEQDGAPQVAETLRQVLEERVELAQAARDAIRSESIAVREAIVEDLLRRVAGE